MITYPKYKSTDIPWLPSIPASWNLVKAKFLFNERVQKGYADEPLLAATQSHGVIPKSMYENTTVTAQKDFHLLKLVETGDFVISLRSFQGGIEYAYYRGIISPAYTIFFPKDDKQINNQFFKYFFKSEPFIHSLTLFVTGIREGQNIDYNEFKNSLLPLPSYNEQTAIANYLDSQFEQINLFISKKQKLIELLKEQKQAIINNAVTKGIDKNVKLKPSGFDWMGNIPSHWNVDKLSRLCIRIGDGLHGTPEYLDKSGIYFINGNNLVNGEIKIFDSTREIEEKSYTYFKNDIKVGAVLMSINGTIGNLAFYNGEQILLGKSAAYFECRDLLLNSFLFYCLQSAELLNHFLSTTENTTIKNLSLSTLRNSWIGLPSLQEQQLIVQYIKTETIKSDTAIKNIEVEIDLINQYKQSLIAEVVIGRIKV